MSALILSVSAATFAWRMRRTDARTSLSVVPMSPVTMRHPAGSPGRV